MKHATVAVWVALALAGVAHAQDLVQVFDDAVRFDPQIAAADATRLAAARSLAAGPGGAAAAAQRQCRRSRGTAADSNSVQPFPTGTGQTIAVPSTSTSYADERGYNVQLQQSVFSWAQWKSLSRAHKQVAQAEADYKVAQEQLIQRVAVAYFNVLSAQDILDAQTGRAHGRHPAAGTGQQALRGGPDPDHGCEGSPGCP